MKHLRLFEDSSEERKYMGTPPNICPVCGEEESVIRKMEESYFLENIQKYPCMSLIIDYKCGVCDFEWYSQYDYVGDYETESSEQIIEDNKISDYLYSAEKIEAKKYNL